MTDKELSAVFREWKRRYDEDPAYFEAFVDFVDAPPADYGDRAAWYFVHILDDLAKETHGAT